MRPCASRVHLSVPGSCVLPVLHRAAPRVLRSKELAEAGEDDDEALADAAVEKDRAWDDWRDDHPKGIGNTKRI